MPPSLFLIFLLALALGLFSLAWAARRQHHHFSPVAGALVPPLLLYNLWVLVWLAVQYTQTSVVPQLPQAQGRWLHALLIWGSMVVALHWGAAFLAFTRRARRPEPGPNHLVPWGLAAVAGALCLGAMLLGRDGWVRLLNRGLVSMLFLTVAVASLHFTRGTRRAEPGESRMGVLGAAYSCLFVLLTGFIWWSRFDPRLSRSLFVAINLVAEMAYNLMTVLWIQVMDRPLAGARGAAAPAPALPEAYGISKREREVIELICQGRTNQEIADALFISLKTVKDHNYRIFQKTGVRNRVELAQLATAGQPAPLRPART